MDDQAALAERVNNFLKRRGLRANYLAQQTGISIPTMYCWKSGYRLLTEQQLQRLRDWLDNYDMKMGDTDKGEG